MQAMLTCADEVTKNATDTLKAKGMRDDTLLVWSSDNSGPRYVAMNNWPYQGGKLVSFKGGVHVISFIAGEKTSSTGHSSALMSTRR